MKAAEPAVGVVPEVANDSLVRAARYGTAVALTIALLAAVTASPVPPRAFASEADVSMQDPPRGVAVSIESSPSDNRSSYRIGETISVAVESDQHGHRVDGERPKPSAGAIAAAGSEVSIVFDEVLDEDSVPPADAFSVTVDDAAYPVTAVSVAGDSVSLTLSRDVPAAGPDLVVTYVDPVDASAVRIRDTAGNAAASFVSDRGREGTQDADPAPRTGREMPAADRPSIGEILAQKALRTPAERKVSSRLLQARRDRGADGPERADGADSRPADDERILVDIRADVTSEVLERIEALGGEVEDRHRRYRSIRARLTPEAALQLAELDAVQTIHPADRARTHQNDEDEEEDEEEPPMRNTSEGDAAHAAAAARATYAVDGTGIGIGVISNGVGSLAQLQASGDLPNHVHVLPGQQGEATGEGYEGAALLEIVHDLAPGADLYFATGLGGKARLAANIDALCRAGADVIVDDVVYIEEAAFQDDVIAQAVTAAVADGCFHFSGAGNWGNLTHTTRGGRSGVWEGDFVAGTAFTVAGVNVGTRHAFATDMEENALTTVLPTWRGSITLQWADPWFASDNDYDLFLVDSEGAVVASSTNVQSGSQRPLEVIETEIVDTADIRVVVVKASGSADRYLRLVAHNLAYLDITTAGSTYGHAASANAFGIGAVNARAARGTDGAFDGTESVQWWSADGPRRMFFHPDGAAVTPGDFSSTGGVLLAKPDLVAADCVTTATPGFSYFCGTSASAPHAAAIAALVLEGAGGPGKVTRAELREAMATTALDIGATGPDRDSGAGIVMAPAAVGALYVPADVRNAPPTVANAVGHRSLAPDSPPFEIDLASVFSDPAGDALTYSARSNRPDGLAVSLTGSTLTLTPGSALGPVVVDLRATDPDRLDARHRFIVTISNSAEHVVRSDWSLLPDGVPVGGSFRLLFMSSTRRDGTSADLSDYDSHVQSAAAGGLADIQGYSSEFAAVVCTNNQQDVFENTGTSADDTDAPIYWLSTEGDGEAVASGYADFYDGYWNPNEYRPRNQVGYRGRISSSDPVITGCENDGTVRHDGLGSGNISVRGWYVSSDGTVTDIRLGPMASQSLRVLALSPIFVYSGADDAALSTLSLEGTEGALLDEEFDPETFFYRVTVDFAESLTLDFKARGAAAGATVSVQDANGRVLDDADPNALGFQVNLGPQRNVFQVMVTAADGTTLTYRVEVSRNYPTLLTNQAMPRSTRLHDGSAIAQVFKTGNHGGGYLLDAVIVELVDPPSAPEPGTAYVGLWSVDETDLFEDANTNQLVVLPWSRPGVLLESLASPDVFVDGPNRFSAPLGTVLEPDTYYYVIVNEGVDDGVSVALSADYLVPPYESDYGWDANNHSYGPTFRADDIGDRQAIPNSVIMRIEGGLLAVSCPIDLGERTAIWWAELSPAELTGRSYDTYGFDRANAEGDLSIDSFDFGGATYEVTDLRVAPLTDPALTVFGIEPRLPSEDVPALALHLCDRVLPLSAGSLTNVVTWAGPVDDWSDGEAVTVALSAAKDALLSGLSVRGATLTHATTGLAGENNEGFEATKFDYTAVVPSIPVTVTATANEPGALIAYFDSDGAAIADVDTEELGHQMDLDVGPNVVWIVVTAGDRRHSTSYSVTIVYETGVLLTNEGNRSISLATENPLVFTQPFTTGSHAHGYRVDTVWMDTRDFYFTDWDPSQTIMRLTEERSGGLPDLTCEVMALRTPQEPVHGPDAFGASRNNRLKPDTRYHLVLNWGIRDSNYRVNPQQVRGRSSESGFGWTMDQYLSYVSWRPGNDPWEPYDSPRALEVRIVGCELHPATQQTLVSNTGQALDDSTLTVSDTLSMALGFTTGDRTTGFTLSSVQVHFHSWFGTGDRARVSIYTSTSSGAPNQSLYVLTNPSSIVDGALNTFTAPENATLDPDTEYFVVVEAVEGVFRIGRASSSVEDVCEASGWSIRDRNYGFDDANGSWGESPTDSYPVLGIEGIAHALVSGLSLADPGGVPVPLNEDFDPATKEYTADVANAVQRVTVEPQTDDPLASFDFLDTAGTALTDADGMADGFQVDLAVGNNDIQIVATSGNGAAREAYVVAVSRSATVPADWSLTPDGVPPGGRFRLLFATSRGRDATSSDIADYNAHVRNAAAAGHADIQAYSDRFTALASTAAVDARTNTGTVASDADVPIYWLSTTTTREAVATGYADFYDGNWRDASARTESGASTTMDDSDAGSVATGSNLDGTATTGGELGTPAVAGWWLSGGDLGSRPAPGSVSRRLLALSPVFEKDATTLVTNEGETPKSMQGAWWTAQAFTTGGHTEGYLLHAVWLDASAGNAYSATDTHVRIVPAEPDGTPQPVGAQLVDLASPATIGSGPDAFTAPPGTVLERRTTYVVVVNRTIVDWEARLKLVLVDSDVEQSGFDWRISDTRTIHPEGDSASRGGARRSLSMRVTGREITNNAPVFNPNTAMRTVPENTSAGVAVGEPIPEAADADDDALTYTLEGTDAASFAFNDTTRQISTGTGVSYNHEAAKNSYEVVVKADDNKGGTGTITVTINVGDENEKTDTPAAPTVAPTEGVTDSLDVTWEAPGLNGGPDITGFKLRYRKTAGTPGWAEVAGLAAAARGDTIGSLESGTEYEVQVQALNGEDDSDWSASGTGTTSTPVPNRPPVFTPNAAMRTVPENTSAGVAVGEPIPEAADADDDTLAYTLEGTDAASFAFNDTTRQISTGTGVSYNHEAAKNSYEVVVKADDKKGGTGTITVTITVEDENEKTDRPAAPMVTATTGATDSLDVTWTAPGLNNGPDITGFKLRYRKRGVTPPPGWTEVAGLAAAARGDTIGSLESGTEYEVQVQALNGEGDSDWSASGTATTGNNAPVFTPSTAMRTVAENSVADTAVGDAIPAAADADDDTLTYTLEGTDAGSFSFNDTTRQISTKAGVAYNFEAKNSYEVEVKADDKKGGTGTITVTITVEDENEKTDRPAAPMVTATTGATDSLDVTWDAPGLNNGPDITGFKLRYRKTGVTPPPDWTEVAGLAAAARGHTIESLDSGTGYEVQVQALNGEDDSDWSASGRGTPGAETDEDRDVRLVGGSDDRRGRLEVFYRGHWGTVCDDRFDRPFVDPSTESDERVPNIAAEVACRLLGEGYVSGEMVTRESLGIPVAPASQRIWLDDVRCAEGSTHWTDPPRTPFDEPGSGLHRCYHAGVGLHNCSHSEDVHLVCSEGGTPQASVSEARLTLRYRRLLDPASTPGPKDWVVRAQDADGARALAVLGATVSGSEVSLELSPPAAAGESVSVSYLPWAMHPLRGADGAELAPLTELEARNETPSAPVDAPVDAPADAPVDAAVDAAAEHLPAARDAAAPVPLPPSSTRLDLSGLGLTDVAALAGLTELEALDLSDNAVADAWPLAGLAALRRLDLSGNRLGDVAALAYLPRLEVLDLSGNAVADAWPLAGLAALRRLDLSDNRLGEVAALAGLPNLEVLVLDGNRIANVLPLALLPRLARLDMSGNRVADALLLAELRSLARLDLAGNRLADAAPLGDLSRLVWLDLTGNPVSDPAPLGRLTALRWLWLDAAAAGAEALAPLRERPVPVRIGARAPAAPAAPSAVPAGQAPGTP